MLYFALCSILLSAPFSFHVTAVAPSVGPPGGGGGTGATRPEENFSSFQVGGGAAKRPKKIFGSFKGGGGREAPEEKFSTKSCNVPGKSLVMSRMVPNGAHIGKSHNVPNGRHRSLVMSGTLLDILLYRVTVL